MMTFNCSRRLKSSPRVRLASSLPSLISLPLSPNSRQKHSCFPLADTVLLFIQSSLHSLLVQVSLCHLVFKPVASDLNSRPDCPFNPLSLCHDPHPTLPWYDNGWLEILIIGSAFLGSSCCVPTVPILHCTPSLARPRPRSTFCHASHSLTPGSRPFLQPLSISSHCQRQKIHFHHTLHFVLTSE
jgi:hypothetical protein